MCIFWTKLYTCGCMSHMFRDRCPDYLRSSCERCPHETADVEVEQRKSYFPCYTCLVREDREEKCAAAAAGMHVEEWRRRKAAKAKLEEVKRKLEEERVAKKKMEERRNEIERELSREVEENEGNSTLNDGVVEQGKAVGEEKEEVRMKAEQDKKKQEDEVWTDVAGSKKWRKGRGAKMEAQPSASHMVSHVRTPSHAIKPLSVEKPSSPSTKPSPSPSPATMSPSLDRPGKPTSIAMPPPAWEKKLGRAMAKEFDMSLPTPWKTTPLAEDSSRAVVHSSPPVVLPSSAECSHPSKSPGAFFGPPASKSQQKNGAAHSPSGEAGVVAPGQQVASSTAENKRDRAHHRKKLSLDVAQQSEAVVMPDLSLFPGEDIAEPRDEKGRKDKLNEKNGSADKKSANSRENGKDTSKENGKNGAPVKDKVNTSPKEKTHSGIDPGGRAGHWGPSRNEKVTILQRKGSGRKK